MLENPEVSLDVPFHFILLAGLAGIVAAHATGLLVSRRFAVRPGEVGRRMPSRTFRPPSDAGPTKRFEADTRRVLNRILAIARKEPEGLEESALASRLDEPAPLVRAALERMRALAPCRLRVTRKGRLLHDFDPVKLSRIGRTPWLALPLRVLLFLIALLTNLGAMWPVIASAVVAVFAIGQVFAEDDSGVAIGAACLFAVPVSFVAAILLGVFIGGVLHPLIPAPCLAATLERVEEKGKVRIKRSKIVDTDRIVPSGIVRDVAKYTVYIGVPVAVVVAICRLLGVSYADMILFVGGAVVVIVVILALFLTDAEDAGAMAILVIVAVLGTVVAAAFAGFVLWGRGLWKSIGRRGAVDPQTSPAAWSHTGFPGDSLSLILPTHEAVLGTVQALWRMPSDRPPDPGIVGRVLGRAAKQGGRISPLEIMLDEGLDLDEAVALACAVGTGAGGDITVSDAADLDFTIPDAPPVPEEPTPRYEALEPDYKPGRKCSSGPGVRVNLPGLTLARIELAERLAAGILLFCLSIAGWQWGWFDFAFAPPHAALGSWAWTLLASMVFASVLLAGVSRYAARASARLGVWRDVRRAAMTAIQAAAARKEAVFGAGAFAQTMKEALSPAWPSLGAAHLQPIVEAAATDLGLAPSAEALAEGTDAMPYDLAPLRERLAALTRLRRAGAGSPTDAEQDDVIFCSG